MCYSSGCQHDNHSFKPAKLFPAITVWTLRNCEEHGQNIVRNIAGLRPAGQCAGLEIKW